MPVSNKAATAAALAGVVLILLAVTGTGARADTETTVPGGDKSVTNVTAATGNDVVSTAATAMVTPPVPPPGNITLGMLERVQQKNLLLAAQVLTAQLQRQLEEAGSETTSTSGSAVGTQPGATPAPAAVPGMVQDSRETTRTPGPVRPQVLEISGKGSALHALLQMPDGSRPEVSTGSRVTVGKTTLTVSRISLTGVTLSDGSELSF
ncbi:TPA: type IV pilus biogenesis protein PilP [Salmonella enterica subsp. enterica serovar Muenchen]